jgi:cellobiose phosphorylase
VRAIRHGFRMGAHGLPLMGTGDWNDGMNKVGAQGKGESVWMAFFLYRILQQFKPLAQSRGDAGFVKECDEVAAGLVESIARNGWDGEWFVRAYFDDGTPLGSAKNDECRMGSIAQSWSVLSGAAEPERARQAMDSLDRLLVDRDNALIKLLSPPFDVSVPDPGYIRAYVPGVRENGGQYTHAAVWAAMAFAELRDSRRAAELTAMLNPVNHALDAAAVDKYKVEPFVVASDVYALPPHTGRGGWTWYSGSAGWLYRLLLESVLGLQREADTLYLRPCVPDHWDGFSIDYRYGATVYHVQAHREGAGADKSSRPGGAVMPGEPIPLVDDGGEHQVRLVLPGTQGPARPG